MYTVPDRRRQGVSRWLVTVLEDHARILGYSRIGLETGSTMTWAISLYTGRGYLPIPTYPPYIGNGYSVCFAKDL
jgi:GNAT superfamily N-acetyltransferase